MYLESLSETNEISINLYDTFLTSYSHDINDKTSGKTAIVLLQNEKWHIVKFLEFLKSYGSSSGETEDTSLYRDLFSDAFFNRTLFNLCEESESLRNESGVIQLIFYF
ncbi:unnamed protein product [Rhizophagus irregularis]|nr:unnamed protein product [Rhizophagus irregularis]